MVVRKTIQSRFFQLTREIDHLIANVDVTLYQHHIIKMKQHTFTHKTHRPNRNSTTVQFQALSTQRN